MKWVTLSNVFAILRPRQLWKLLEALLRKRPTSIINGPLPWCQEERDEYTRGGYHRVQLGDRFRNQRYLVLRKLGYGEYSTVWLAQDTK